MRWIGLLVLSILALRSPFLCGQTAGAAAGGEGPDVGVRRFELGGQFTDAQLTRCYAPVSIPCDPAVPQFAVGPGVTLNLNTHLALDASYRMFTGSYDVPLFSAVGGRGTELLVGVRAEARAARYGLFAFARPGLGHWNGVVTRIVLNNPETVERAPKTFFASEVGGGVEYFPSSRVHVRMELGDLLVDRGKFVCGGCPGWASNLQTSAGVYVGVGHSIAPRLLPVGTEAPHRFFDRTNLLLIGVSLLGQSADDITTQRFHSHGEREGDPLARPFVDQGWGGQIGLAAIVNAAEISVMYGLHRMGHHRIERVVPLGFAVQGGLQGYRTLQDQ